MKKIYKSVILSFCLLLSVSAVATVHHVNVNGSNFSPSSISVIVGDTVHWSHVSGNHTTTSTTIPAGAMDWDSNINSSTMTFEYVVTVAGTYDYVCTPHQFTGQFIAINTGIETPEAVSDFNIYSVHPSVYNLSFVLTHSSVVKVSLFDLTGKIVKVLQSSTLTAGEHMNSYNMEELRKGIYLFELLVDNKRISKRLIID